MEFDTETLPLFLKLRKSKMKNRIGNSVFTESEDGSVSSLKRIAIVEKPSLPPEGEVYISRAALKGPLKGKSSIFSLDEWLRIPIILGSKAQPYSFKLLNEEEKEVVLKEFNATADQFPTILGSDIISRIYGAKEGDLIEIRRVSPDKRESLDYRGVKDEA